MNDNCYARSFSDGENILELDSGGLYNFMNILKTTLNCTLKMGELYSI